MRTWALGIFPFSLVSLAALAGCSGNFGPIGNEPGDAGGGPTIDTDAGATTSDDASAAIGTSAPSFDAAAAIDAATAAPPDDASTPANDGDAAPPVLSITSGTTADLRIDHDVSQDGLTNDRFTWSAADGTSRSAVLAHNDGPPGAGGSNGGELRELDYVTNGTSRVVRAPATPFGGFGYVVGHRSEGTTGLNGADDSPLGHFFPGTWTRVFEGANHAIFRFTQTYPRYSRTDATPANQRYDVPVTIDWVISAGRTDPLWSITYDLSGVPADAVDSDSRAPYGELLIDGSASLDTHSQIAGVGWGDRYKFTTSPSAGPVTFDSPWSWDQPNTVPYVDIWTSAIDATMGIVQTQTLAEHEAGGYWGIDRWGTTSAAGNACTTQIGSIDSSMPCDFNWPYQSIQYSLSGSSPTSDPRLAWGTEFGFLGQTAYYANGSEWYGGPDTDRTVSGWPKQSYSTYVVLGAKSGDPVGANVSHIEAVQTITTTAAQGSVAISGPAGIARTDTMTYAPAGYDPIYGALTYVATNDVLDANLSIGSGTLSHPLVIVRNWVGASPSMLRFDGATLKPGADAFVSLRSDAQELWITLNRDVSGPSHRLQIEGRAQAD